MKDVLGSASKVRPRIVRSTFQLHRRQLGSKRLESSDSRSTQRNQSKKLQTAATAIAQSRTNLCDTCHSIQGSNISFSLTAPSTACMGAKK